LYLSESIRLIKVLERLLRYGYHVMSTMTALDSGDVRKESTRAGKRVVSRWTAKASISRKSQRRYEKISPIQFHVRLSDPLKLASFPLIARHDPESFFFIAGIGNNRRNRSDYLREAHSASRSTSVKRHDERACASKSSRPPSGPTTITDSFRSRRKRFPAELSAKVRSKLS